MSSTPLLKASLMFRNDLVAVPPQLWYFAD